MKSALPSIRLLRHFHLSIVVLLSLEIKLIALRKLSTGSRTTPLHKGSLSSLLVRHGTVSA